jgi:hypothetical protein
MFDSALTHHYLVQEAARIGSTFTFNEKVKHLVMKYKVSFFLAIKAVQYLEKQD